MNTPKPNNSEKKTAETPCLGVYDVKDCNNTDEANLNNKSNLNLNNLNNLNNINNLNNLNNTSILTPPENKIDLIYYFLYDNGEQTGNKLKEIGEFSSIDSFNVLRGRGRNRGKIIISRKQGTINYYDLSQDFREQLTLQINQALEKKQRIEQNKAELEKQREQESQTQEELLTKFKEIILDRDIFCVANSQNCLNVQELKEQYPEVYELLLTRPAETKQLFEVALEDSEFNGDYIRFTNLSAINPLKIENFRSKHLGKAICSEVRVTSITPVRPQTINAKFECPSCGTIISVLQIDKKFKEPSRCSCGRRGGFKEIAKDMVDACLLQVEDIEPQSQIPVSKNINCFVKDFLLKKQEIEKLTPGNSIRIFGELKEVPLTSAGGQILTRFDWGLDVIDIEEFDPELNSTDFSEEEIKEFKELSSKIDAEGLDPFIKSFAPDVEGYKSEKSALIIQSAQRKNKPGQQKTKSHLGIIGDPGQSKTILSKFALKVTQGSSYSSGSGASGVGLTASVIKEEGIGFVLKPGQLPLTRELAVIDEYNLISEEDRPKLQEAMSEGEITINKAGIHANPSVPCGILALMNPIKGSFDLSYSISKQFNILPQQLNRFDALFVQIDEKNSTQDEKIAEIMLKRQSGEINAEYDTKFLRKFFTFIRSREEPTISNEAKTSLTKFYKKAREMTKNNSSALVNPRFLESLIRFSTGYAKLRQSDTILKKDVEGAFDILASSYLNLGKCVI